MATIIIIITPFRQKLKMSLSDKVTLAILPAIAACKERGLTGRCSLGQNQVRHSFHGD